MKTMMKKRGISAALMAVVLVMAALIIGCSTGSSGGEEEQFPEGMGGVKISFADTVEQRATILPGTISISSFTGGFKLIFTKTSSGEDKTVNMNVAETPTIPLVAGTYSLTVLAYLNLLDTSPAASYDSPTDITVGAGTTQNITITLTAIADDGQGTFAWNITNQITPALVSVATMTITPIGTGSSTIVTLTTAFQNDPSPISGTQTLSSGYYYVDFALTVDSKPSSFRHILHVYENLTSTFTYTFTNTHFSIGMVKVQPAPTYTHPTDLVPAFNVATPITGNGSPGNPYKLSVSSATTNPNVFTITVSNATLFTGLTGRFGGTDVSETSSGEFVLTGGTSPCVQRAYPYQFIVIGTAGGKSYESAEIFISVVTD